MTTAIDLSAIESAGAYKEQSLIRIIHLLSETKREDIKYFVFNLYEAMLNSGFLEAAPIERYLKRTFFPDLALKFALPNSNWHDSLEGNECIPLRSRVPVAIAFGWQDLSFQVIRGGSPVAFVECQVDGLSIRNKSKPLNINYLDDNNKKSTFITIISYLKYLMKNFLAHSLWIAADAESIELIKAIFSDFFIETTTNISSHIDLTMDEKIIYANIRKSYRSLVNKGRAELTRSILSIKDDIDINIFRFISGSNGFKESHYFDFIKLLQSGDAVGLIYKYNDSICGFVGLARLECGLLKYTSRTEYIYHSGAYDKNIPIPTHYCLYDATIYCKDVFGGTVLHLINNEIAYSEQCKRKNIHFFKQGFATHTSQYNSYFVSTVPVSLS